MSEPYAETVARIRRAIVRLEELRDKPTVGMLERARLSGKVEGVKLTLSYFEELDPSRRRTP